MLLLRDRPAVAGLSPGPPGQIGSADLTRGYDVRPLPGSFHGSENRTAMVGSENRSAMVGSENRSAMVGSKQTSRSLLLRFLHTIGGFA